jgi:hypothetical protein
VTRDGERIRELEAALERIGYEMPTSERNPDGEEQAAFSMQLVARAALGGENGRLICYTWCNNERETWL